MNLTQKYKKNFGAGWWQDSFRHSLASKGIKTGRNHYTKKKPVFIDEPFELQSTGKFRRDYYIDKQGRKVYLARKDIFVPERDVLWKKGNVIGFTKDGKFETGTIKSKDMHGFDVEYGKHEKDALAVDDDVASDENLGYYFAKKEDFLMK